MQMVVKNLRKGQDMAHTLVLDQDLLRLWPEIHGETRCGIVDQHANHS